MLREAIEQKMPMITLSLRRKNARRDSFSNVHMKGQSESDFFDDTLERLEKVGLNIQDFCEISIGYFFNGQWIKKVDPELTALIA